MDRTVKKFGFCSDSDEEVKEKQYNNKFTLSDSEDD